MAKNYNYGFDFSESGGRTVIRYRQDKLWFQPGCGWWVTFSLMGFIFMLMTEPAPTPGVQDKPFPWGPIVMFGGPIAAVAGMAYWRSRKREIIIDEKTMTVEGKPYDRAQITRVYAKHKQMEYNYTHDPAYYDQQRQAIARQHSGPFGSAPTVASGIASASATAGQLSTGVGLAAGEAILATRQRVQMVYGGKNVVIAKGLSIQRASMLVNAIGGSLGFKGDAA
jgi:hypothetical protein